MSGPSDDAWEEYLMTGKSGALARYVASGGEIDDDVRELIAAELLKERPIKRSNRSDHWRDYTVYVDVRRKMLLNKIGVIETAGAIIHH